METPKKPPIKLKIVGNGTMYDTRIEDEEGRPLHNVTGFSYSIEAPDVARVTINLVMVPIELDLELQDWEFTSTPRHIVRYDTDYDNNWHGIRESKENGTQNR